jgi:hypothetical protein
METLWRMRICSLQRSEVSYRLLVCLLPVLEW